MHAPGIDHRQLWLSTKTSEFTYFSQATARHPSNSGFQLQTLKPSMFHSLIGLVDPIQELHRCVGENASDASRR